MELTFVVAAKDIWQLQPYWPYPRKACDQGRSVGKIKFIRNRKFVGVGGVTPEYLFQKTRALNCIFVRNLKRCFGSLNC